MPWFLAGLVYAGIYVGTAILSAILNRNAGRETPPGEPTFPKADPTAPIPVVFGTTRVGVNFIHKARITKGENTVRNGALSFGWSSTRIGAYYYGDLAAVLCHGPVGAIHDLIVDRTKALSRITYLPSFAGLDVNGLPGFTSTAAMTVTGSLGGFPSLPVYTWNVGAVQFTITAGDLFGGKMDRGGFGAGSADAASTGTLRFYPGCGWNESNADLEALAGQDLPTYPNLCWVAFEDNFYFGNQPAFPSIEFVVTRPCVAPFLGTGLLGDVTANSGADASAAGVLWEILTNPVWGLGLPVGALDQSSFDALDTACNGGLGEDGGLFLGLSFVVDTQVSAKALLSDVLRTLDGVLYTDPETGLICVRLLQHTGSSTYGYGIFNEYILDASVIQSVEWTESAPDAQANEVKVEFVDRARDYTKNTVTVRNVAAIQALGRVESRTVTFVGVQNADVATRLGMRELRTLSTSVGHATITCDRTGYRLTPGQFFTLNWDVAGKTSRVMRCLTQKDAPNGMCVIEAVEDVYSTPATTFEVETTPEPTPVDDAPWVQPYVEPRIAYTSQGATETLLVYDPQGVVTAIEFQELDDFGTPTNWHAGVNTLSPYSPYVNLVTRLSSGKLNDLGWRVTYTAQDGSTQYLQGDFPQLGGVQPVPPPVLRWSVSGGTVTVTASWFDTLTPDLYLYSSSSGFTTYTSGDTPVTSPYQITFPYPAAGAVVYVSAVRRYAAAQTYFDQESEYAYLTITGDGTGGTTGGIGTALTSISTKEVFVRVTEASQWLALSTIPASEVEIGTEYRTQRYLVGAGQVRFNANIKTLTGTPTLKLKYSTNAFGSVADVLTWAPGGTGQQSSGWATVPSAAQVDAGLTLYIADGANTAALDLYDLDAEFRPAAVTALRDFSSDFSSDFS